MPSPKDPEHSRNYERIEKAIHYLSERREDSPSLEELAHHLKMSPFHLQRLFRLWAGVSPKKFLQYLTLQHAKAALEKSQNVLEASFKSGLSGPGRLHDLLVTLEAVTPGEFKSQGEGLRIDYGTSDSPFGACFVAATDRGILQISFIQAEKTAQAIQSLKKNWKNAELVENQARVKKIVDSIFRKKSGQAFHLILKGTHFQIKVWEALLKIPPGFVLAYEDVADLMGKGKAVRAVASAIAKNPVAYLIPCHRVIRKNGALSGYRWSPARKKAILAWESFSFHPN